MLYEFKSRATGTVVMTGPVAEQMLAIVGKAPGPQGIFTVEQMGAAIAALQTAIERERTERESDARDADRDGADEDEADRTPSISLAQRAWPLMDMLRAARAADQAVTWGI